MPWTVLLADSLWVVSGSNIRTNWSECVLEHCYEYANEREPGFIQAVPDVGYYETFVIYGNRMHRVAISFFIPLLIT